MACGIKYGQYGTTRCDRLELKLLDEQARTLAAQRRADEYHRSNIAKDRTIGEQAAEIRRLTAALEEAQESPRLIRVDMPLWEAGRDALRMATIRLLQDRIADLEKKLQQATDAAPYCGGLGVCSVDRIQDLEDDVRVLDNENSWLQARNDTQAETIKGLQEDLRQIADQLALARARKAELVAERDEARAEAHDQARARDYYFNLLLRYFGVNFQTADAAGVSRSCGPRVGFPDPQPMPKKGSA